jgi:hypothetical protein
VRPKGPCDAACHQARLIRNSMHGPHLTFFLNFIWRGEGFGFGILGASALEPHPREEFGCCARLYHVGCRSSVEEPNKAVSGHFRQGRCRDPGSIQTCKRSVRVRKNLSRSATSLRPGSCITSWWTDHRGLPHGTEKRVEKHRRSTRTTQTHTQKHTHSHKITASLSLSSALSLLKISLISRGDD